MKVKVINTSDNKLPAYETTGSAGMDLRAKIYNFITLRPGERMLIPTGLKIQLPKGYEAQVRPRSGLALKKGITVLNSPGTIDSDYTGEIGVILINHGKEDFIISSGERIAQLVFNKVEQIEWEVVDSLEETERGEGGFGSTGTKDSDQEGVYNIECSNNNYNFYEDAANRFLQEMMDNGFRFDSQQQLEIIEIYIKHRRLEGAESAVNIGAISEDNRHLHYSQKLIDELNTFNSFPLTDKQKKIIKKFIKQILK